MKKKKQKTLKNGMVIQFIKSDGYIHNCFKPFEKAVWNNGMVTSQKYRNYCCQRRFAIADKRIFRCIANENDLGKYFVIAKRAKKIRGKKRKSKDWSIDIW